LADWLASHDVGAARGAALETARNDARGTLLTLSAGTLAAGALAFTARSFVLSRRTFELTEQGQVTDRYTRAIEQLGSDKADVRIGGIYALERVARDSARDHPTVIEVLSTFLREHSTESPPHLEGQSPPAGRTRADVQAALTVIGRRSVQHDVQQVDLSGADLTGADLTAANLSRVKLSQANLTLANLTETNLDHAILYEANFTGARLLEANLTSAQCLQGNFNHANLARANLTNAILVQTDLTEADFFQANLAGTVLAQALLVGANLTEADLSGANLTLADLAGVNLGGAKNYPGQPPAGWKPGRDGSLRADDEHSP
jgi:uncharacterized protein YjbI with pentapeptide repeats